MKYDSKILNGARSLMKGAHFLEPEGYSPYEFASAEKELNAARETAWIGVYLMMCARTDVSGPDAVTFLNSVCVNRDFGKLKIGGSRHGIVCDEKGRITSSGIITRMSEDRFRTYCMIPDFMVYAKTSKLNIKVEDIPEYFIQIDGPKSLEILEEASQCDIHDLKFAQNKYITIEGKEVYVHRLGMSGALAYEIHGPIEEADLIYDAVVKAGEKYGAQRQGIRTYMSNHTPGGYPNQFGTFIYPDNQNNTPFCNMPLYGSAADDQENYYITPYDAGWGNLVNFEHEFPGKAALMKIAENPPRVPVTLEWNLDDVMTVYKGEIDGTGVEAHEGIFDFNLDVPEFKRLSADIVMADGEKVGVAAGRVRDYYHKKFLSLAFINKEYAEEGRELSVMWGKPGKPQMAIRATVVRFPYYQGEYRNETFDTNKIPRRF